MTFQSKTRATAATAFPTMPPKFYNQPGTPTHDARVRKYLPGTQAWHCKRMRKDSQYVMNAVLNTHEHDEKKITVAPKDSSVIYLIVNT